MAKNITPKPKAKKKQIEKVKISAQSIKLHFFPTVKNGTTKGSCDIEFIIEFDKKGAFSWKWNRKGCSSEVARQIFETSRNKSVCAVNLGREVHPDVRSFAETKASMFLDEVPQTNFAQYSTWLDLLNKVEEFNEKAHEAEKAIWQTGGKKKEKQTSIDDVQKFFDAIQEKEFANKPKFYSNSNSTGIVLNKE